MKTIPNWLAAVALSAAVTSAVPAFGQAQQPSTISGAQRAQQDDQQQTRQERQQQQRAERQADKEAGIQREQLRDMPRPVRLTLRGETAEAKNVERYFRVRGAEGQPPTFGAQFTDASGHEIDLRVDREGKVISRSDLTAQTASAQAPAQAPATPAPGQPAQPAPTPAPGTTTPAPTPAQPGATASKEAPPSGDPIYRRLQANEIPQNVRTVLDREAQGGKEVEYYRTKYGRQLSYTVSYNDAQGQEHDVYVADDGRVLTRHGPDDDDAATASASEKAKPATGAPSGQQYGRVEMNALPKQVQTQFSRLTEGGSDVKFYTTKYGQQSAFLADFRSKDGKQHKVYVDESGKILSQKAEGGDSK